ncbi:MAG TPA: hypothetical protein VF834_11550 [Streptosporangiaceae bacterium]
MTGALSARRRPTRLAAGTAAVAGACIVLAGSAYAAMPGHSRAAGSGHAAVSAVSARPASGRSLQTLFSTVRVFSSATRAGVKGKLIRQGTGVSVTCWTTGSFYRDEPIWYEISAPIAGYVSAFDLAAHYSPAFGVPHCVAPVFKEQFNGLEADLRIRTAPSTTATISGYLVSVGSKVVVDCYVRGTSIFKDPIWYHALSPARGYVSGRMLNTGSDPAAGIPRC